MSDHHHAAPDRVRTELRAVRRASLRDHRFQLPTVRPLETTVRPPDTGR